jgi:hypothetical protein
VLFNSIEARISFGIAASVVTRTTFDVTFKSAGVLTLHYIIDSMLHRGKVPPGIMLDVVSRDLVRIRLL